MKKFILAAILSTFAFSALAQDKEIHCLPFAKVLPELEKHDMHPVFLAIKDNKAEFVFLRDSTGYWQQVIFKYTDKNETVACLVGEGDDSVTLQQEPKKVPTETN